MSSWPMLVGILLMVAIAAVDAYRDRSSRKPMSWPAFLRVNRRSTWWTRRRTKSERAAVALSIGKDA